MWRKAVSSSQAEVDAGIYRAEIRGGSEEEIKLGVNLSKKSDVLNLLSFKQELEQELIYNFTKLNQQASKLR